MPEFITEKIDASHDRWRLRFASDTFAQAAMRVVPEEIPSTHELKATWRHFDRKAAPELVIELVEKGAAVSPAKAGQSPITLSEEGADRFRNMVNDGSALVCDLKKLTQPDLETRAGVAGVSLYLNGTKRCSRAQLIARIAEAEAKTSAADAK